MTVAMKKIRNRPDRIAADVQLIDGIKAKLASDPYIRAGGREFSPAALVQFVQRRIDAANAIAVAKAAWLEAIRQYEEIDDETSDVVQGVRSHAIGTFGKNAPELAAFGITPPKTPAMSAEKMVEAVAKRAATRAARGTKGPKAKLKIKGVVPTPAPEVPPAPAERQEHDPDTPPTPLS
jgi:hypothetical protein